jgi:hypothetical protein
MPKGVGYEKSSQRRPLQGIKKKKARRAKLQGLQKGGSVSEAQQKLGTGARSQLAIGIKRGEVEGQLTPQEAAILDALGPNELSQLDRREFNRSLTRQNPLAGLVGAGGLVASDLLKASGQQEALQPILELLGFSGAATDQFGPAVAGVTSDADLAQTARNVGATATGVGQGAVDAISVLTDPAAWKALLQGVGNEVQDVQAGRETPGTPALVRGQTGGQVPVPQGIRVPTEKVLEQFRGDDGQMQPVTPDQMPQQLQTGGVARGTPIGRSAQQSGGDFRDFISNMAFGRTFDRPQFSFQVPQATQGSPFTGQASARPGIGRTSLGVARSGSSREERERARLMNAILGQQLQGLKLNNRRAAQPTQGGRGPDLIGFLTNMGADMLRGSGARGDRNSSGIAFARGMAALPIQVQQQLAAAIGQQFTQGRQTGGTVLGSGGPRGRLFAAGDPNAPQFAPPTGGGGGGGGGLYGGLWKRLNADQRAEASRQIEASDAARSSARGGQQSNQARRDIMQGILSGSGGGGAGGGGGGAGGGSGPGGTANFNPFAGPGGTNAENTLNEAFTTGLRSDTEAIKTAQGDLANRNFDRQSGQINEQIGALGLGSSTSRARAIGEASADLNANLALQNAQLDFGADESAAGRRMGAFSPFLGASGQMLQGDIARQGDLTNRFGIKTSADTARAGFSSNELMQNRGIAASADEAARNRDFLAQQQNAQQQFAAQNFNAGSFGGGFGGGFVGGSQPPPTSSGRRGFAGVAFAQTGGSVPQPGAVGSRTAGGRGPDAARGPAPADAPDMERLLQALQAMGIMPPPEGQQALGVDPQTGLPTTVGQPGSFGDAVQQRNSLQAGRAAALNDPGVQQLLASQVGGAGQGAAGAQFIGSGPVPQAQTGGAVSQGVVPGPAVPPDQVPASVGPPDGQPDVMLQGGEGIVPVDVMGALQNFSGDPNEAVQLVSTIRDIMGHQPGGRGPEAPNNPNLQTGGIAQLFGQSASNEFAQPTGAVAGGGQTAMLDAFQAINAGAIPTNQGSANMAENAVFGNPQVPQANFDLGEGSVNGAPTQPQGAPGNFDRNPGNLSPTQQSFRQQNNRPNQRFTGPDSGARLDSPALSPAFGRRQTGGFIPAPVRAPDFRQVPQGPAPVDLGQLSRDFGGNILGPAAAQGVTPTFTNDSFSGAGGVGNTSEVFFNGENLQSDLSSTRLQKAQAERRAAFFESLMASSPLAAQGRLAARRDAALGQAQQFSLLEEQELTRRTELEKQRIAAQGQVLAAEAYNAGRGQGSVGVSQKDFRAEFDKAENDYFKLQKEQPELLNGMSREEYIHQRLAEVGIPSPFEQQAAQQGQQRSAFQDIQSRNVPGASQDPNEPLFPSPEVGRETTTIGPHQLSRPREQRGESVFRQGARIIDNQIGGIEQSRSEMEQLFDRLERGAVQPEDRAVALELAEFFRTQGNSQAADLIERQVNLLFPQGR